MSLWSYLETNSRLVIYERSGFIILATGVDVFEWDTLGERSSLERNVQMWGNHFELKNGPTLFLLFSMLMIFTNR